MKRLIYFADLTHNGLILSSNVFPLSIGLVAAYLCERKPDDIEVELFKYPEGLSSALDKKVPDIVGFANYSWNFDISRQYARAIKRHWPNTVIVFGGPNYGLTDEEINEFWKTNLNLDFHVVQEGEEAFVQLYDNLVDVDFDANEIKLQRREIGNVHYQVGHEIIQGPNIPRLNLEDIPSPYIMGMMDKFFDENLTPMIHTTRGCPFKCKYCTEGNNYYNIVSQREAQLEIELNYISQKVRGPRDLIISDANFGMFKQDYEKARIISDCQRKYDYPKTIFVSTGKNRKERVIDISKILNGAVSMAASLQSTDPTVLENISRSNISIERLAEAGKMANTNNMGTYSELILGLPGDSIATHTKSLRDTVEMSFDNIRIYQLIMLPQTDLNTPANRLLYEMKTKHRIMPRSFGRYTVADETFSSVESEEILVSNSTLSFDEYITCREMDLTIEILHNGKVFLEVQGLCKALGLSWFDFIQRFFVNRYNFTDGITKMYNDFKADTSGRLWDNVESLKSHCKNNIDEMLKNERGTNEMSTGKATSFFQLFEDMNKIVFSLMGDWLKELGQLDNLMQSYLDDLQRFSFLRKQHILSTKHDCSEVFSFDLKKVENNSFKILPEQAAISSKKIFWLSHNLQQGKLIANYTGEFGGTLDGLGKMLMRYPHIHHLFRIPFPEQENRI
tara:strand:+ start:379 stop:2409 length:2031 start_codon:yes stop_codon:yes gene_type:complete